MNFFYNYYRKKYIIFVPRGFEILKITHLIYLPRLQSLGNFHINDKKFNFGA